jgi:hypothetical protein
VCAKPKQHKVGLFWVAQILASLYAKSASVSVTGSTSSVACLRSRSKPQRLGDLQIACEQLSALPPGRCRPPCGETAVSAAAALQRFRMALVDGAHLCSRKIDSRALRRAAAASRACPAVSAKRLLEGALQSTSATAHNFGHRTRCNSATAVVWNSKQGRSRTVARRLRLYLPGPPGRYPLLVGTPTGISGNLPAIAAPLHGFSRACQAAYIAWPRLANKSATRHSAKK